MNRQELTEILRQYKEETGMNLRLVREDGRTVVSTWSLRGQLLQWLLEEGDAPGDDDVLMQDVLNSLAAEISEGCALLLVEGDELPQSVVQEAAGGILAGQLVEDACTADREGRSILLIRNTGEGLREASDFLQSGLEVETMSRVRIAASRPFTDPISVPEAYREARMGLLALHTFTDGASVRLYTDLGLTLAALQLSPEDARMYLHSCLGEHGEDVLTDSELMRTARGFWNTGLNAAETARQLCVHRNTLNYRLEKICRLSGRDIKRFEDAAAFWLAALLWERLAKSNAGISAGV